MLFLLEFTEKRLYAMKQLLVVLFGALILVIIVIGLFYPQGLQESDGGIIVDEIRVGNRCIEDDEQ